MKGSILPPAVNTPGLEKANTERPKLTAEQEEQRRKLLRDIESLSFEHRSLAKQTTDDRSAPIASGKRSTGGGWLDLDRIQTPAPNPTNKSSKRLAEALVAPQVRHEEKG